MNEGPSKRAPDVPNLPKGIDVVLRFTSLVGTSIFHLFHLLFSKSRLSEVPFCPYMFVKKKTKTQNNKTIIYT